MTEQKPGLLAQLKSYPPQFWVANTMEIFERMSWYGWYTVMGLYVTGSIATGGLGFTEEDRGALQAIVPFFLYVLPVFTGAIADRYGYKRTFIVAYTVMIVSYYLLGQFTSFPAFFLAFMFVAVGAALFKPVVVGTVAKVTDDSNSATGFGIFYMMVNIGGFLGPIVAGVVRGQGWGWVFVACSLWATVNLVLVLSLYREPPIEQSQREGRFRKVLDNMVEVLGNVRFFAAVFVVLFVLMFANLRVGPFLYFTWLPSTETVAAFASTLPGWLAAGLGWLCSATVLIPVWLVLNFVWDRFLPAGSGLPESRGGQKRPAWAKRMYCSNWRFALFLLIMSGFWTSFNQIFITMPQYIRDFVETRPMIEFVEGVFGASDREDPNTGVASKMATINDDERAEIVKHVEALSAALDRDAGVADVLAAISDERFEQILAAAPEELQRLFDDAGGEEVARVEVLSGLDPSQAAALEGVVGQVVGSDWRAALADDALDATSRRLLQSKVRIAPRELKGVLRGPQGDVQAYTNRVMTRARQVNPEFIVNIDAGAIVLFQVLISFLMARFHRFTTMIAGMVIAAVGIGLSAFAGGEGFLGVGASPWIVAAGIFIFAIGEMMASPTSQEYVGRIAPADKKALYMGYYFVAIALGNLFGGILSGEMYGRLARDMQRPDLMWLAFGGLMLLTALVFLLYDRFVLPRHESQAMTES